MAYDLWIATHSVSIKSAYLEARDWNLDASGRMVKLGNDDPLPMWLVSIFIGGNVVLWSLNVFWLGQMVKAMRKRFTSTLDDKKSK
jgi:hypothetical protein